VIGLPTLGQLDRAAGVRIWLATQPADMRCGFDRLAELAARVTGQDPLSGHLFLFRSRGGEASASIPQARAADPGAFGGSTFSQRLIEGTLIDELM